jgi:uncharacterized membrane protein YbhN (UPF0104 family)
MKLSRNIKIFINYFLGPLLFTWLSWSIYQQIRRQPDLEIAWQHIRDSLNSPLLWNVAAVFLLMFVNWGIEAIKWKISVRQVQEIGFFRALLAVFSGVSFSVTTPNRVGEYIGRLFYMKEGNRLKTISITIVSSLSQLIITIAAGLVSLLILRRELLSKDIISPIWFNVILYGVILALTILLLFYFRLSRIIRWIDRLPALKKFVYLVEALESFSFTILFKLLLLSFLRFFVFLVQYYLLFIIFNVDISFIQCCLTISISFLVMAAIPIPAIAELGQRGKVITTIVGLYSTNEIGMTFATAGIWFINLIIPALIGSLLILRLRKIVGKETAEKTERVSVPVNN